MKLTKKPKLYKYILGGGTHSVIYHYRKFQFYCSVVKTISWLFEINDSNLLEE